MADLKKLETQKVDPQPWTIYSKVFEKKEGGKSMDAQKSMDLIDSMIKSTPSRKAYLGEVAIPEKKGEKPKFTGEGAMRAGEPVGGGGVLRDPASEKVQSKMLAAAGLGGPKKSLDKAGLFGGEGQGSVPAGQVMSKLGAGGPPGQGTAPTTPGQGSLAGQTISMQSVVPKKKMGEATPAGDPGAMKPGATVSMQKIASAQKAMSKAEEWEKKDWTKRRRGESDAAALYRTTGMYERLTPSPDPVEKPSKAKKGLFVDKGEFKAIPIMLPAAKGVDSKESAIPINLPAAKGFPSHPISPQAKAVEKALCASSLPRVSRGMAMAQDQYRSATSVMTRGNSRFAKDIHTGPLTGEVIQDVDEAAAFRTHQAVPMYKSCCVCGRTYMAKAQDAECPTCSMNKSLICSCGHMLVKGPHSDRYCPLCS